MNFTIPFGEHNNFFYKVWMEDDKKCMWMNLVGDENHQFKKDNLSNLYRDAISRLSANDIYVPLSGGVDSECLFKSCLASGKHVTPVICDYVYKDEVVNFHDTIHSKKLCLNLGITYKKLVLDLEWFYSGKWLEYCKYECRSPQHAVHLWIIEQIEGFVVLPGDFLVMVDNPHTKKKSLAIQEYKFLTYEKFMFDTGRNGIPNMAMYNLDILYNTMLGRIAAMSIGGLVNPYSAKTNFISINGWDVVPRKNKFTGFEKFKEIIAAENNTHIGIYNRKYRDIMEASVLDVLPDNFYCDMNVGITHYYQL